MKRGRIAQLGSSTFLKRKVSLVRFQLLPPIWPSIVEATHP